MYRVPHHEHVALQSLFRHELRVMSRATCEALDPGVSELSQVPERVDVLAPGFRLQVHVVSYPARQARDGHVRHLPQSRRLLGVLASRLGLQLLLVSHPARRSQDRTVLDVSRRRYDVEVHPFEFDRVHRLPQRAGAPLQRYVHDLSHDSHELVVQPSGRDSRLHDLSRRPGAPFRRYVHDLPRSGIELGFRPPVVHELLFVSWHADEPLRYVVRVVPYSEPAVLQRHVQPPAAEGAQLPGLHVRYLPPERILQRSVHGVPRAGRAG